MTTTTKPDQMYDDKRDVTKNGVVPEDESAVMMVPQPEPPDQSKRKYCVWIGFKLYQKLCWYQKL